MWAASGIRVPGLEQGFQSTLERNGDVAAVLGGLEAMGLKGSPHVDPAGLTAHGLRGSPYSVQDLLRFSVVDAGSMGPHILD